MAIFRIFRFFFCCILMMISQPCLAQFRDSSALKDTINSISREDYIFSKKDSSLHIGDIALQFLAAEAAFNITSFSIFGDNLYKGLGSVGGGFGILLTYFTVPLAIHFTTELLHLKTGSWGWATLGACIASIAGVFILPHPETYLTRYLSASLPVISFSLLVYDLTIQ